MAYKILVRTFVVLLFLSLNAIAANQPPVNAVVQSNVNFNATSQFPSMVTPSGALAAKVILSLEELTLVSDNYYAFQEVGGAANATYQVPTGKTLFCSGFNLATGFQLNMNFGYGTATFTNETAVAPTGAVYYGNATGTATGSNGYHVQNTGGTAAWVFQPFLLKFPADSFPFVQVAGTAGADWGMQLDCLLY